MANGPWLWNSGWVSGTEGPVGQCWQRLCLPGDEVPLQPGSLPGQDGRQVFVFPFLLVMLILHLLRPGGSPRYRQWTSICHDGRSVEAWHIMKCSGSWIPEYN